MNRMRYFCPCLVLFALCVCAPRASHGQSETGLPTLASYSIQQIDSINLSNLNAHIQMPLFTKKARGYTVSLEIDGDTNDCGSYEYWVTGSGYAGILSLREDDWPKSPHARAGAARERRELVYHTLSLC